MNGGRPVPSVSMLPSRCRRVSQRCRARVRIGSGRRSRAGANGRSLWDYGTPRQEIRAFKGHEGPVSSVAFSPDGARVLTGSDDNTARCGTLRRAKKSAPSRGTRTMSLPCRCSSCRPTRQSSTRRKICGTKSATKSSKTMPSNPSMPCAPNSRRQSSTWNASPKL
jgi:WD40 repeat protein